MVGFFVLLLAVGSLSCAPAWLHARRRGASHPLLLLYAWPAVLAWLALVAAGVGPRSPAPLLEPIVVATLGVAAVQVHVFLLRRIRPRDLAAGAATLVAAAACVRLALPAVVG